MEEQFYRLVLDEYAAPSFCTVSKGYYGTLADIHSLMDSLDTDERYRIAHADLIKAFRAYGQSHAEPASLLEPVLLLGWTTLHTEKYAWTHINIWDCPYHMRCDFVETSHYWLRLRDHYFRVVKARFDNLQYHNPIRGWVAMPHRFWGFPKMIVAEDGMIFNRLAVVEKTFSTSTEAEADMAAFPETQDVDFSEFCNDIFGDG